MFASCEDSTPQHGPALKGPVIPLFPSEKLVYLVPAGWHTAHVVQSTLVDSIEYVPTGQDRLQWTDMVTAVWMTRAMYHHLADASATMRAILKQKCAVPPVGGELRYLDDNGFDATIETIACGKTPEGFGHVAVIKTIKSDDGYFQLQRAWRFPPTADSHRLVLSDTRMRVAQTTLSAFHLIATNAPAEIPK